MTGEPVASLQGLDEAECVFYVGTFSKAMLSDIRIGYASCPTAWSRHSNWRSAIWGSSVSTTLQVALSRFIVDSAYAAHIRRMTRIYEARRDRLVQALALAAPEAFNIARRLAACSCWPACSARMTMCCWLDAWPRRA